MTEQQAVPTPIPRHVFISYAREDSEDMQRLLLDVRVSGLSVWVDDYLSPGTSNWDTAIRRALSEAYAVILVASPAAAASDAVAGELALARALGDSSCTIIPVWFSGTVWAASVPVELIRTQYIDCRADQYEAGLSQLIKTLKGLLDNRAPKHFVFGQGDSIHSLPSDYLAIALEHEPSTIALRPNAYPSLRALLDDLYLTYLTSAYPPHTYGQRWLLLQNSYFLRAEPPLKRALVTWDWLLDSHRMRSISSYNPDWSADVPQAYGLGTRTSWHRRHWVIISPKGAFWGIATNSEALAKDVLGIDRDDKMHYYFGRTLATLQSRGAGRYSAETGFIAVTTPENVDIEQYRWRFEFHRDAPQDSAQAFICDIPTGVTPRSFLDSINEHLH